MTSRVCVVSLVSYFTLSPLSFLVTCARPLLVSSLSFLVSRHAVSYLVRRAFQYVSNAPSRRLTGLSKTVCSAGKENAPSPNPGLCPRTTGEDKACATSPNTGRGTEDGTLVCLARPRLPCISSTRLLFRPPRLARTAWARARRPNPFADGFFPFWFGVVVATVVRWSSRCFAKRFGWYRPRPRRHR
jgi:hypothetical protein